MIEALTLDPFNGTESIIADALEEWGDDDSRYRDFASTWANFIRDQCDGVGTGERQLKDEMLQKVILVLTGRVYKPGEPVNPNIEAKENHKHFWFDRVSIRAADRLGSLFFHRGFPGVFRCDNIETLTQKDSSFNKIRKKIPVYGIEFDLYAYRNPILTPGDKTTDYIPFFQPEPLQRYGDSITGIYRIPLAKRWRPSIVVNAMLRFNMEHSVFIESLEEYFGLTVFK